MHYFFRKFLVITLLAGAGLASDFIKQAETPEARLLQTGATANWCPVCGMNLKMFYKTNHALKDTHGDFHQYCSIRCLAVDLPNYPDHESLWVVDAESERFINVEDVVYVTGSKVPGTMSAVSKIAFKSKRDARRFNKAYAGEAIRGFDETFRLAQDQLMADNKRLMAKKQNMIIPKGAKLFQKYGAHLDNLNSFNSIAALKAHLRSIEALNELNEQQLQMLAVYLQEGGINSVQDKANQVIKVPQDAKCPVCGMFVFKYPRWAAVIHAKSDGQNQDLYFDGVKDLMKFYFQPDKWGGALDFDIINIHVTDYYLQKSINGQNAFYVIGSDILGPMGNELIPFTTMLQANTFSQDHQGTRVLTFQQITPELLQTLD